MNQFPNIITYLAQANTPLSFGNYNEVDALVLAQLSYFPFEKIYSNYEYMRVTVPQFAKDIMKQSNFLKLYSEDKRAFIIELQRSKRYVNCIIHDMKTVKTTQSQWAAFTVDIGNFGTSVIAMRGTDGTTVGWTENFQLAHDYMGTGAQLAAFRYIKNIRANKFYLTGHSKGGNNVSAAYVMSNPYIRDKVVRIDNFDGPGVNPEFAENYSEGFGELDGKLYNFYPQDSIIGLLLEDNPGHTHFIKANMEEQYSGLLILRQHNPFTFMVKGNEFVKTNQTNVSKNINYLIDNLMNTTTNQERYYLVQLLDRIGIPALIARDTKGICSFIQSLFPSRNGLHNMEGKDIMR